MIEIKDGVKLGGLRAEMVLAVCIVEAILHDYGVRCVITSGRDGKHKDGSLHYKGLALDFRAHDLNEAYQKEALLAMQTLLGPEYQVLLEVATDPMATHFHVEFDPKP